MKQKLKLTNSSSIYDVEYSIQDLDQINYDLLWAKLKVEYWTGLVDTFIFPYTQIGRKYYTTELTKAIRRHEAIIMWNRYNSL